MKLRRTKADALFSDYIRIRDRWTCQRCFKKYEPPTQALHAAHCFSRSNRSTRFEPRNAISLCYGCHSFIDRNAEEKIAFFKKKLGEKRYELLRIKSKLPEKIYESAVCIWLKQEIEKLK